METSAWALTQVGSTGRQVAHRQDSARLPASQGAERRREQCGALSLTPSHSRTLSRDEGNCCCLATSVLKDWPWSSPWRAGSLSLTEADRKPVVLDWWFELQPSKWFR